jgi:D-glycero-beta-D-manno-heptose 1-phosphate adenylyltransferase
MIHEWKELGLKVVFTNGVFDILHVGHVDYLEKAKAHGDRLIVAINSDSSVRRLDKGPERPINPEEARARVVGALRCVDATIIFEEDTPLSLITMLRPDVLVKGGDYDPAETNPDKKTYIVGSREVRNSGGAVLVIDLVEGYSTTGLVSKLKG